MSPAGRAPLSSSTSHSKPSVPAGKVAVWPAASVAMLVLRQKRNLPSAAVTAIESLRGPLTTEIVPERAFSGRPPSAARPPSSVGATLKRGSRHVPVHVGVGALGSLV